MKVDRDRLLRLLRGLMEVRDLSDLHAEILRLCRILHVKFPEGNFVDGWTEDDWKRARGEYLDKEKGKGVAR